MMNMGTDTHLAHTIELTVESFSFHLRYGTLVQL